MELKMKITSKSRIPDTITNAYSDLFMKVIEKNGYYYGNHHIHIQFNHYSNFLSLSYRNHRASVSIDYGNRQLVCELFDGKNVQSFTSPKELLATCKQLFLS